MRWENCIPRTWAKIFMRHYAVHLEMYFIPPNTGVSRKQEKRAEKAEVVSMPSHQSARYS